MSKPGPGKFEGNASLEVSEALYAIVGESGQDEDIGNVGEGGWFGLILNPTPTEALTRPAYIVSEDNYGFFWYVEYGSQSKARSAWKQLLRGYK
jgi:hypothetical protein